MKPTPEQILSALNKMIRESKTELKAEKVELGSIKMIEAIIKDGKAIFKRGEKFAKEKETPNVVRTEFGLQLFPTEKGHDGFFYASIRKLAS